MAQINKGTTFVTGGQVTADNLNNLVQNAALQPEAITGQAQVTTVADTHLLLTTPSTGASLNKVALSAIVSSLNLAKTNANQSFTGNLTMAGGADITLTSGSALTLPAGARLYLGQDPVAALEAVTKQYADNTFLKDTGGTVSGTLNVTGPMNVSNDITMTGASSVLTLSATPTSAMHAATKTYVDGTYSHAQNGYQQFSNGLIVNWGTKTITDHWTDNIVTFAKPFTAACYIVLATGNEPNGYAPCVTQQALGSFKAQYYNATSIDWIAIGL